jgi:hypothetical protein
VTICFCTLAIHPPYRRRARLLCRDAPQVPWVVLTDEPAEFADLPVRAIRHIPTGPMAVDYLAYLPPTGGGRGGPAYHDKRFALLAALEEFDTAIYLDADSRILKLPSLNALPKGIAVLPVVRKTIVEHLSECGSWRLAAFEELAKDMTGDIEILQRARWCHEAFIAITNQDTTAKFFESWSAGAQFLQSRGVYSGEGGVIGLAAAQAGWDVDYETLARVADFIQHEGGGPKRA